MRREYWIQALALVRRACKFFLRWKNYLPIELATPTDAFILALTTYCDILVGYDNTHARGKGVGPVE